MNLIRRHSEDLLSVCLRYLVRPQGCSFVHDQIPLGYYRHAKHPRRKAKSPSDESMALKQA